MTSNDIVVTIASDAEAILKRLGILMSTAVDMFLNQVVLVGGIPIWKLIHFYILLVIDLIWYQITNESKKTIGGAQK